MAKVAFAGKDTSRGRHSAAQPRALQARPTISFRTDRSILEAIDDYARHLGCTRNDLMEAYTRLYLADRGEDVAELVQSMKGGQTDEQQLDIFK